MICLGRGAETMVYYFYFTKCKYHTCVCSINTSESIRNISFISAQDVTRFLHYHSFPHRFVKFQIVTVETKTCLSQKDFLNSHFF